VKKFFEKKMWVWACQILIVIVPLIMMLTADFLAVDFDVSGENALSRGIYKAHVTVAEPATGLAIALFAEEDAWRALRADYIQLEDGVNEYDFTFHVDYPLKHLKAGFVNSDGTALSEDAEVSSTIEAITLAKSKKTYTVAAAVLFFICLMADVIWLLWRSYKDKPLKERAVPVAIAAITLASSCFIFLGGVPYGHDIVYHLFRIEGLREGLAAGQFPVKVQPLWMNGYGYASSVFYGDILLLLPALMRMIGFTVTTSYGAYVIFINFLTALFAYFAFKKISGNSMIGLACSAAYSMCQYRLVDVYQRADIGEFSALAFAPLVLCGLYLILTKDTQDKDFKKGTLIAVAGYSGLIQTHVLSCEVFGLFTIFLCILCIRKVFEKARFFELLKVVGITTILNLWFILPLFDYLFGDKFFVNDGSRIGYRIQSRGVPVGRLFSPVYHGEFAEVAVCVDLVLGVAFFAALFCFILGVKRNLQKFSVKGLGVTLILVCLALFMCTNIFPYDALKNFSVTNEMVISLFFPWKFMEVVVLGSAFLLCSVLRLCLEDVKNELITCLAVAGVILVSVVNGIYYQQAADLEALKRKDIVDVAAMSTFSQIGGEYVPSGTDTANLNRTYVYNLDGSLWVPDYSIDSREVKFYCENGTDNSGIVTVPRLFYRGYRAVAEDGQKLELTKDELNAVSVVVPAGFKGNVRVFYREPFYWRIAELISLISLIALLVIASGKWRKHAAAGA